MGFSRPFRSLTLPNGTVRILAEPSNNINLLAASQLFGPILLVSGQIALTEMQVTRSWARGESAMLGFSHDFCRCS